MSQYSEQEDAEFFNIAAGTVAQQFRELVGGYANLALAIQQAREDDDQEALTRLGSHLSQAVFGMVITALPSLVLHLAHEINVRTDEALTLFEPVHDELPKIRQHIAELTEFVDFRALDSIAQINDCLGRIQDAHDGIPFRDMYTTEGEQ